jgi:hypothetical protein
VRTILLLLIILPVAITGAQQPTAPPTPHSVKDVWVLQMCSPACEYAVRMSALQTVTLQDYDMRKEGKVQRVVEMTVETTGGNRARFYWEDKPTEGTRLPSELAEKREAVEQAVREMTGLKEPAPAAGRVQKDYPVTTHGAWAEFKLETENEVRNLHTELMQAWTGKKREP